VESSQARGARDRELTVVLFSDIGLQARSDAAAGRYTRYVDPAVQVDYDRHYAAADPALAMRVKVAAHRGEIKASRVMSSSDQASDEKRAREIAERIFGTEAERSAFVRSYLVRRRAARGAR
jgi:hypothetical protein